MSHSQPAIERHPPAAFALLKLLRPWQWVKNLLVFAPLLFAHQLSDSALIMQGIFAFISLSFVASAVYVINDWADVEADRLHPTKKRRPVASGAVSRKACWPFAVALLGMGVGLATWKTNTNFVYTVLTYFVLTTGYTFYFKRIVIVDVLLLAILYTLRIVSGGLATVTPVSEWLLAFSMFIFASLAFAKRYSELYRVDAEGSDRDETNRRGYRVTDLPGVEMMGIVTGYLSVLVLALYVKRDSDDSLYAYPQFLWGVCVCMMYWVSRLWIRARRGELNEDPVAFTIKDPASWIVGVICIACAAFAAGGN